MAKVRNRNILAVLVVMISSAVSSQAQATTLTGFGGTYLGAGEAGLYGGEITFSLVPTINLGGFYEYSKRNASSSSSSNDTRNDTRSFYGFVGRFQLPLLSF